MSYWRRSGIDRKFVRIPDGSFIRNPGKSPDFQSWINLVDWAQPISRTNITRRAFQVTHEDDWTLLYRSVEYEQPPSITWDLTVYDSKLQVAWFKNMQFRSVSRGCEMLALMVKDFSFTGNSIYSLIDGDLPIAIGWKTSYTYFRVSKAVNVSIFRLQ